MVLSCPNEANWGGGIANSGNTVAGSLTVKNSTFSANGAQHNGGKVKLVTVFERNP
jgi:hypothetical protein